LVKMYRFEEWILACAVSNFNNQKEDMSKFFFTMVVGCIVLAIAPSLLIPLIIFRRIF